MINPEEGISDIHAENASLQTWEDVNAALEIHNSVECSRFTGFSSLSKNIAEFFRRRRARPVQDWPWLEVRSGLEERGKGIFAKCEIPKFSIVCDYWYVIINILLKCPFKLSLVYCTSERVWFELYSLCGLDRRRKEVGSFIRHSLPHNSPVRRRMDEPCKRQGEVGRLIPSSMCRTVGADIKDLYA